MIEPWFSAEAARGFTWLAYFSLLAVLGHYVKLGRYRRVVTLAFGVGAAVGALLLAAALAAYWLDQPRHVVRPLLVSGGVMTAVFFWSLITLPRQYAEAELRRMTASDLRG